MENETLIAYFNETPTLWGFTRRYSNAHLVAIARRFFPKEMETMTMPEEGVCSEYRKADETAVALMILAMNLPDCITLEETHQADEEHTSWVVGVELEKTATDAEREQAKLDLAACQEGLELIFNPHGALGEACEFKPARDTLIGWTSEATLQAKPATRFGAPISVAAATEDDTKFLEMASAVFREIDDEAAAVPVHAARSIDATVFHPRKGLCL